MEVADGSLGSLVPLLGVIAELADKHERRLMLYTCALIDSHRFAECEEDDPCSSATVMRRFTLLVLSSVRRKMGRLRSQRGSSS